MKTQKTNTASFYSHGDFFLQIAFTEMESRGGRREDVETQLTKQSHMGRLLSDALHRNGLPVIDSNLFCVL